MDPYLRLIFLVILHVLFIFGITSLILLFLSLFLGILPLPLLYRQVLPLIPLLLDLPRRTSILLDPYSSLDGPTSFLLSAYVGTQFAQTRASPVFEGDCLAAAGNVLSIFEFGEFTFEVRSGLFANGRTNHLTCFSYYYYFIYNFIGSPSSHKPDPKDS